VTPELTAAGRRALASGILVLLLAILWLGVAQPTWNSVASGVESRGIALRALKRNRALLRERPAILAAAAAVEQSPRWRNFYQNQSAEAATLQMETDLRAIFKESNNPTSIAAQPAASRGTVTRIAVRVTLSMRVDQLAQALDRLQKHTQQLRIESLTIQAPEMQSPQANPALTVQAEIAALMVTPAPDRV
jgi:hypothetical protein